MESRTALRSEPRPSQPETSAPDAPEPTGRLRVPGPRARFAIAAVASLAVLLGIALLTDPNHLAITDEGVVLSQAESVRQGEWGLDLPFPDLDPDRQWSPLVNTTTNAEQYFPYVKHAAYPLLVAGARAALGPAGPLVVSALGVWAAAMAGAFLARRVRPGLETPTLLLLALGSPMVFDVGVVMAHGLGAACVGWLVLAALHWSDRGRPATLAALATLAVATTMIRSEGLLAVGALAGALLLDSHRAHRRESAEERPGAAQRPLLAGVVLGVAGVGAYLVDGRIAARVVGDGGLTPFVIANDTGLIEGRAGALWTSMLRLSYSRPNALAMLGLLLAATALVVAAVRLRRAGHGPRHRDPAVVALLCVAAGCSAVAAVAGTGLVPGLFIAFPVLPAGLVLLERADLRSSTARICLTTCVLTALAIWATSYEVGGGAEWGGRYYRILLPIVTPFALLGLARAFERLRAADHRRAVAAVTVVCVAMSASALVAQAERRDGARSTVEHGVPAALAAGDPGDGGAPVVVSQFPGLGRFGWAELERMRLLTLTEADEVAHVAQRLAVATEIERWTHVTDSDAPQPVQDDAWIAGASRDVGGWRFQEYLRS